MKEYLPIISLTKNSRGVYSLDPVIGCGSGMRLSVNGCYSDCYAAKNAKLYGFDFSKPIRRYFKDSYHVAKTIHDIRMADMSFIRMGTMGDPSEYWDHTVSIAEEVFSEKQLELFEGYKKHLVIITKHWNHLNDLQVKRLANLNAIINTSVSALDRPDILLNSLSQHFRIKNHLRCVLRVVTCDFNKDTEDGAYYSYLQECLLKNTGVIDTVFRPSKNNSLVKNDVIKTKMKRFITSKQLVSKINKQSYLGRCENCPDKCGATP